MKIAPGMLVKMEYELRIKDGEVIESSEERGPIEYLHGAGLMLPGLEKRIAGLKAGDTQQGVIPTAEAYGPKESLPTTTLTREDFPIKEELVEGKNYEATDPGGKPVRFTILEILDQQVKIRFDHPLAGKDISFKVKILEVREGQEPGE